VPSFILIHSTVWPQYTNVTDKHDRQHSIGRKRFTNAGPKISCIALPKCKENGTSQQQVSVGWAM